MKPSVAEELRITYAMSVSTECSPPASWRMHAEALGATQEVVEQDKGRTPQGSHGSHQVSDQEAASAGAASAPPLQSAIPGAAAPSEPATAGGTPQQGLAECLVSPSPTGSKNEAAQARGRARAAAAAEAAAAAGFRPHDKAAESPDGHVVALKACASETAAREPILSPTRVLLKG